MSFALILYRLYGSKLQVPGGDGVREYLDLLAEML